MRQSRAINHNLPNSSKSFQGVYTLFHRHTKYLLLMSTILHWNIVIYIYICTLLHWIVIARHSSKSSPLPHLHCSFQRLASRCRRRRRDQSDVMKSRDLVIGSLRFGEGLEQFGSVSFHIFNTGSFGSCILMALFSDR